MLLALRHLKQPPEGKGHATRDKVLGVIATALLLSYIAAIAVLGARYSTKLSITLIFALMSSAGALVPMYIYLISGGKSRAHIALLLGPFIPMWYGFKGSNSRASERVTNRFR